MKQVLVPILLLSCTQQSKPIEIKHKIAKEDTVSHSKIMYDSAVYYYGKQVDYSIEWQSYEMKYLNSGNPKDKALANKYFDSSHYYFLLLEEIANK